MNEIKSFQCRGNRLILEFVNNFNYQQLIDFEMLINNNRKLCKIFRIIQLEMYLAASNKAKPQKHQCVWIA